MERQSGFAGGSGVDQFNGVNVGYFSAVLEIDQAGFGKYAVASSGKEAFRIFCSNGAFQLDWNVKYAGRFVILTVASARAQIGFGLLGFRWS